MRGSGIPFIRAIVPPRRHSLRYRDTQDRPALIMARLMVLATLVTAVAYLVWLFFHLNPYHPWISGAFMAAEIVCLLLFLTAAFTVWRLRYKPPEGLPVLDHPAVDVFITVCGEPLEVVRATIDAACRISWPGPLALHVLDDGASDEVRAVAEQHGVKYLSRPHTGKPVEHAKAGNLNFGLLQSDGEFILVLDADQVPHSQILIALTGYMRFPDVGFIQSRQMFLVPEGDPFFSLDRVFYEAVQLGYDNRDNALSCGSGVLYRRAALDDNGGFSSWNVVEDLTTSYDLHSRGWRSFYYPYALTRGLAPFDIWGVYRQRGQWALDTMRLFFWDNPFWKRGLRWATRVSYGVIGLTYLSAGLVFPLFFVIPPWTYLTGGSVLAGSELEFAVMRGLYFVTMAVALRALFRGHEAGRQFQMLVGLFPVYLAGTLRAFVYPRSRSPRYTANNTATPHRRRPALLAVLPQLLLLAANALLPFYAIFASTAPPRLILSNTVISAVAIWSLLPVVVAALEKPVWNEQNSPHALYGWTPETDR